MNRLLLIILCLIAFRADAMMLIGGRPPSSVCTEDYAPSLTVDQPMYIGQSSGTDFHGGGYTPEVTGSVCKIDLHIQAVNEATTLAGKNIHCRIFTIDGNGDVDTIVGTSSALDADSMVASTWTSANAGYFEFSPSVELSSIVVYAITFFVDTDSDLTDDPEFDADDYVSGGYDNESNVDAFLLGRTAWTWDSEIPYVDQNLIDAEDDIAIKVFTDQ